MSLTNQNNEELLLSKAEIYSFIFGTPATPNSERSFNVIASTLCVKALKKMRVKESFGAAMT